MKLRNHELIEIASKIEGPVMSWPEYQVWSAKKIVQPPKAEPKMYTYQNFYIPERMMSGLENWVLYGIKPGSFLTAVLENDMVNAVGNADIENMQNLPAYAIYCYNELPAPCWGSKAKVAAWEAMKLAEREAEAKLKANTTSAKDALTT